MKIDCQINGHPYQLDTAADRRVVDLLREDLGLTGTKEGCGTGECGACTILVDGAPRLSCLTVAAQLDGRQITTIEGLAAGGDDLHPLQQSFVDHGAVQCGYCTPGMVLTAGEFLNRSPEPTRQEIAEAISGNICRCTGYQKIIDAIATAGSASPLPPVSTQSAGSTVRTIALPTTSARPVFRPGTLEELWALQNDHPAARVFAGGTDLLVWRRQGRIEATPLICLERIEALRGITVEGSEVRIGAAETHAGLLEHPVIGELFPVLTMALASLGSPHIRRMGTIGGNIVTASPASDSLPPLQVLDAEVELVSPARSRRMPLASFVIGPGRTVLLPDEILSAVILSIPPRQLHQHFEKVGLRAAMACAVASLAAMLELAADGTITSVRLAWGSVGPTVVRAPAVEEALTGKPLTRKTLTAVIPLIQQAIAPIDDLRASAAYRRTVAGNLPLRLLRFVPAGGHVDR